jgi:hypothetical protein
VKRKSVSVAVAILNLWRPLQSPQTIEMAIPIIVESVKQRDLENDTEDFVIDGE